MANRKGGKQVMDKTKSESEALKETMHRFAEITAWMRYCCYGSSKIRVREKPKND